MENKTLVYNVKTRKMSVREQTPKEKNARKLAKAADTELKEYLDFCNDEAISENMNKKERFNRWKKMKKG